jgi:hypothetical protein
MRSRKLAEDLVAAPLASASDTDRLYVLVEVRLIEGAEPSAEDCHDDGSDAIAGSYGFDMDPAKVALRPTVAGEDSLLEAALDIFHDQIGIDELDNYEIDAKQIASPDEAPEGTSWR